MKPIQTSAVAKSKVSTKQKPAQVTREMLETNLHELYWCEKQLAELLPEFSKLATSYELTSAVEAHLAVTENQLIRLIHVFDAIDERAIGSKCEILTDIISNHPIFDAEAGYDRDRAIISCCHQIMEHEIKTYRMICGYAVVLKQELAAEFLASAVKEEENTYRRLNEISLSSIYFDAAS